MDESIEPCIGCDCGLRDLKKGMCARVRDVTMNRPEARRLIDLGFINGAAVTMLRPGATCIVRLGTTRLGLCSELQNCVRLRTSLADAPPLVN